MKMNHERDFAKLFRHIGEQNFETKEELEKFLEGIQGKKIDDIFPGDSTKKNKKFQSQDLVYEAYEKTATEGKKLIKEALELDPNNADAYVYLAGLEKDVDKALKLFEKGVKAGEKSIGKRAFKEDKGHFWGIFETRPFMRAKAGLAECLSLTDQHDEAIRHYQELLELNPGDNQGIRYSLCTLLLEQQRYDEYDKLYKEFEDEGSAHWCFNYALYLFMRHGETKQSDRALQEAFEENKYVIDYLLGIKKLPKTLPAYMGIGDRDEAVHYVADSWRLWGKTDRALEWLLKFKQRRLRVN